MTSLYVGFCKIGNGYQKNWERVLHICRKLTALGGWVLLSQPPKEVQLLVDLLESDPWKCGPQIPEGWAAHSGPQGLPPSSMMISGWKLLMNQNFTITCFVFPTMWRLCIFKLCHFSGNTRDKGSRREHVKYLKSRIRQEETFCFDYAIVCNF